MGLFAALDTLGRTRFVGDVARGAACGCVCPICKGPLVAKQGEINAWHFAHESGLESPECVAGAINLLRRMAIEYFMEMRQIPLPRCSVRVMVDQRWPEISEQVSWESPWGEPKSWFANPAKLHAVAALDLGMHGETMLFVEIGELESALEDSGPAGSVLFHCPAPGEGDLRTEEDAKAFLQRYGRISWRSVPDIYGKVAEARDRLQAKLNERLVLWERMEKERKEQELALANRYDPMREARLRERSRIAKYGTETFPEKPVSAHPLPDWVAWKQEKTSFYAFKMKSEDVFWVLLKSATHHGYFVVPAPIAFEGWDEALPPSIGQPDMQRNAYVGRGSMDAAVAWFYGGRSAASRIDSDGLAIAQFVGATGFPQ